MPETLLSETDSMASNDRPAVALVHEGLLNPNNIKGSNLGLRNTLFALKELGYSTVVVSMWDKGVDECGLQKVYDADRFVQIVPSQGDIEKFGPNEPSNVRFVVNGTRHAILNSGSDVVVLWGNEAIAAGQGLPMPTIGCLGVPEYSSLWYRLLFDLKSNNISGISAFLKAKQMFYYYRMSRRNLKKLAKSVDILMAPDFNNANTHSFISRQGTRYFPSQCGMKERPDNWVMPKTPQVLFINAPGSHSQASLVYMQSNITKHLQRLKNTDVSLKFIGLPSLPSFIQFPEGINKQVVIQDYTLPIEPELWNSIALVMCSPLKFGSSMRVKSAMACGAVPIVHPNVCNGLPELKHGSNCLVANSGHEYVEHITTLLNDPITQKKLSINAMETVKKSFSTSALSEFWFNIIEDTRNLV